VSGAVLGVEVSVSVDSVFRGTNFNQISRSLHYKTCYPLIQRPEALIYVLKSFHAFGD